MALATGFSLIFSDALRSEGQTMVRRPAGSRRFGDGLLPGRNGVCRYESARNWRYTLANIVDEQVILATFAFLDTQTCIHVIL
jgi:hypothetical protein